MADTPDESPEEFRRRARLQERLLQEALRVSREHNKPTRAYQDGIGADIMGVPDDAWDEWNRIAREGAREDDK